MVLWEDYLSRFLEMNSGIAEIRNHCRVMQTLCYEGGVEGLRTKTDL